MEDFVETFITNHTQELGGINKKKNLCKDNAVFHPNTIQPHIHMQKSHISTLPSFSRDHWSKGVEKEMEFQSYRSSIIVMWAAAHQMHTCSLRPGAHCLSQH